MPIYMKYGDIVGDVTDTGHLNWVEITSFSWGVTRTVSNAPGAVSGRSLSAPRVSDVQIVKDQDVATIPFFQASLVGSASAVTIDFVTTGQGELQTYYTVKLTQAIVTSFVQSSGGERPTESMTLNFTECSVAGVQMDSDGTSTTPANYGWNVTGSAPV